MKNIPGVVLCVVLLAMTGCNRERAVQVEAGADADAPMIRIHVDPLEQFVRMAEGEADEQQIEALLKTPGFQGMIRWQNQNWSRKLDEDAYRNMLQAVFLPEQYELRDIAVYRKFAERLQWGKDNPEQIREFVQSLQTVMAAADPYKLAAAYLPEAQFQPVNVYFVIGLCQGAALPDGNFIDPDFDMTMADIQQNLVPNIAHEAHHTFRQQLPVLALHAEQYRSINRALFMLESEGFANSITHSLKDWDRYIEEQKRLLVSGEEIHFRIKDYILSHDYMEQFNTYLVRFFAGELADPRAELRAIFWPEDHKWPAYHPVGQRMATIIDRTLGRDRLISCLGKPALFLATYNEAAIQVNDPDNVFIFDTDVVDAIQVLPWAEESAR